MSLSVKYRPQVWDDVMGQRNTVAILKKQIETNTIHNAYLLKGCSGAGKTTLARLFAKYINKNIGEPIEIDAASNSGVDNVRNIIASAQERSIDGEYKLFIIDEAHSLSAQAWQAFLKCIEEPPAYTIFIFCTTEAQKIPATILNRVQTFVIHKISNSDIFDRLVYICEQENINCSSEGLEYIVKCANGSMRDAITMLDECVALTKNISIDDIISRLGKSNYENYFVLTNSLLDVDFEKLCSIIYDISSTGIDMKTFIDGYFDFVVDVIKYIIYQNLENTSIPNIFEEDVKKIIHIENVFTYYNYIMDRLMLIKHDVREDNTISFVIASFMQIARGYGWAG